MRKIGTWLKRLGLESWGVGVGGEPGFRSSAHRCEWGRMLNWSQIVPVEIFKSVPKSKIQRLSRRFRLRRHTLGGRVCLVPDS